MSLVVGTREIEFNVPSGKVAQDETISRASGLFFGSKTSDVLTPIVNTASSQPRISILLFSHPTVDRYASFSAGHVPKSHGYLFLYLFRNFRKGEILHLLPIFGRSIYPSIFLSCGEVCTRFWSLGLSLIGGTNFGSRPRRHGNSNAGLSASPSFLLRKNSVMSLSSICDVGETRISRYLPKMSNPFNLFFDPLVTRGGPKNNEGWFKSETDKLVEPNILAAPHSKLCRLHVMVISEFGKDRLSNVTDKCGAWISQSIYENDGIIGMRLGSLLKQVAHGFTSGERGGAAPFILSNSTILGVT